MIAPGPKLFRTGSQMIADGAIRAGCRFFAGYPITPASGIYKRMIDLLQQRGDVALSSPDEISALAYCVGASMRGFKSMTATSGPGWALMIETVQYALMTETPVVIAMVQRLGPSTGGATQGAQGDILVTGFCTSGGYTIPVLCPSTAAECYSLTIEAFNWAESLRTPVVLLSDKEVAMTSEAIDTTDMVDPVIVTRETSPLEVGTEWKTYGINDLEDVPTFSPVGGPLKVTATGSAHNTAGRLRKNDPETLEILYHLEEKIRHRASSLELAELDDQENAESLVISYGVTARAMGEAVRHARRKGRRVSSLKIQSLFPIPERIIAAALKGKKRVIIAEENMSGQYRMLLSPLIRNADILGVNCIGRMITPSEIENAIS